jgi:5-methylcytosine-specific restriction endonuclease McrA
MDDVASYIERAVIKFSSGRYKEARDALQAVDVEKLITQRALAQAAVWGAEGVGRGYKLPRPAAKRTTPSRSDIRATFQRDMYTCRYQHCQRPTIELEVLKVLSRTFPDLLPYYSNWMPVEKHILYWIYSTSLEHQLACADGGSSRAENLLTSCYLCNDVKNYLPLSILGWSVAQPATHAWSGLREYLPGLRRALQEMPDLPIGG